MTPATDRRARSRTVGRSVVLSLIGLGPGCGLVDGQFTPEQWEIIETLSPREPIPDDPTNRVANDPQAAALGQALFFDRRLAAAIVVDVPADEEGLGAPGETGRVACADCHDPDFHFADGRFTPTSLGVDWAPRNAPTALDFVRSQWFLWDGRADSSWQTATVAVEAGATQNSNRLKIAHLLHDDPDYARQYEAVFGPFPALLDTWPADGKPESDDPALKAAWKSLDAEQQHLANEVFANFAKAIAAYCRQLVTGDAPFDRYVAGDYDELDDAAKRGLALFVGKAGCIECHSGPNFTDGKFHNIGLDQKRPPDEKQDNGRWDGIDKLLHSPFNSAGLYSDAREDGPISAAVVAPPRREEDMGAFRTPSLRNVAETAPYMHDGSLATLEEVVAHYNWGGDDGGFPGRKHPMLREELGLSDDEMADIVAFLETLTGDLPHASLRAEP